MYHIGIDFGGMSIKGGLVDENGTIVYKEIAVTKAGGTSDEVTDDLAKLITAIIEKSGVPSGQIESAGIGFPGTVDSKKGVVVYTPNVDFKNYPVVARLKERLKYNLPVIVNNDANCAALGEALFGKIKVLNAILVTLGTGVGTGIVVDGQVFEGYRGMGAEGGHMRIKTGGERCGCGNRGCFEAYASATALIKQTAAAIDKNPDSLLAKVAVREGEVSGKTAFIAAREGCRVAAGVVKRYTKYVGDGIISLLNLFGSEYVIVGGGISKEGEYFIKPLARYVNRYKYGHDFYPKTKVIAATLYNDAGIIGAANLR